MLIRILPAHPSPSILFTLTLPDPTHDTKIECPPAWRAQAKMIEEMQEQGLGVEAPQSIHAMDKAAWHSALMTEVVFDVPARVISCMFVDGSHVTWPLTLNGDAINCLAALEEVVEDVQSSALEHERERGRYSDESYTQDIPSPTSSTFSHTGPLESSKHKRHRSLFSSIVSALKGALSDGSPGRTSTLPLSLPPIKIPPSSACHARSGSTFSRTQRSPPLSPVTDRPPAPVFQLRVRPRAPIPLPEHCRTRTKAERLRHRARSKLVDTLRRYVFPMFSTTDSPSFAAIERAPEALAQEYGFPPGLYPGWIGRSALRRTEERMREMIVEANAHGFGHALGYGRPPPSTQRDGEYEEDDASAATSVSTTSVSTETDGSSVHTPTDSPARSPFYPAIVAAPGGLARIEARGAPAPHPPHHPHVPRSPSPQSPTFDFDMSEYHALSVMRTRLLHALSRLDSSPRQISSRTRYGSDLTILEIKSRRRAWSSRDYVGGARMTLVGLATPVYSSPLARCEPVTAESLARAQSQASYSPGLPTSRSVIGLADLCDEFGVKSESGVRVGIRAVTKEMDTQLFPVCEEDEDEDGDELIQNTTFYQAAAPGFALDDDVDDDLWRDMRDLDLESGLLAFPPAQNRGSGKYSSLQSPQPRARTQSMRTEHPLLPPTALLCQPLGAKAQAQVPVPVVLDRGEASLDDECEDCEEFDVGRARLGGRGSEFTLSMDLPPPPRGWLADDGEDVACR